MSPQPGSGGPAHYAQATAPLTATPGDRWFDGVELRVYDAINGWVLPGGASGNTQALSQKISVLSQQVSVLSQQISVISAGLGGVQMQVVGGVQGVSSTVAGGIAISGLSASVASTATYEIDGRVLYQMSGASATGVGLALTFPAGTNANFTMRGISSIAANVLPLAGGTGNEDASGSIIYSVALPASGSTLAVEIAGIFATSTTAGTVQVLARVSTTTVTMNVLRGSYLRAYKIA